MYKVYGFVQKKNSDIGRGDILVDQFGKEVTVSSVVQARQRGYLVALLEGGGQKALGHRSDHTNVLVRATK